MPELKSYELEKKLWTSPGSLWSYPALLLLGEEFFLKEELIFRTTQRLGLSKQNGLEKIDAESVKGEDILIALETSSFDDYKKIIVIYNADKIKTDTCKKMYELWEKGGFPDSSLPIFIADKVDGRRQMWKLVKEEGVSAKFWKMFEDCLIMWTEQRFKLENVRTASHSAEEMVALCGNDPRKIAREISKIALVYDSTMVTPDIIRLMVKRSVEASKFDIEDKFMIRDMSGLIGCLEELPEKEEIKDVILSLARYCRYAIQAKFYINRRDAFALQLADLGNQIYASGKVRDWANISKRNDAIKIATDIISKIPTTEKMIWTGERSLHQSDDSPNNSEQDSDSEPKTKGSKKGKADKFDIEADEKKTVAQDQKKKEQAESYDLYTHNMWAQRSSVPVCKAFAIGARYTIDELTNLLIQLSRAYYSVWAGEEHLLRSKLDTILLDTILVKSKGD